MSIFKKFNLSTKIAIGFGTLILILLLTILFGYHGLSNNSQYFSHYRKIAKNDVLAGKIQANLLDSQIHFKNYIVTGDSSDKKEFEKQFADMEKLINEAHNNIVDTERAKKIDLILQYAQEYKEGFNQITDYQDKRNILVLDVLTSKGTEIEENLAKLMKLLSEEKKDILIYRVGETQRHFMLGRLHVGKYLEDNKDNFVDIVTKEFSEMDKWLEAYDEELLGEKERELFVSIREDKNTYTRNFKELVSLIKSRNEIINRLNDIGLKISDTAEEIKLSIIEEQNSYGPKVKKTNDKALYQMGTLSVIAIILSILVSVAIIRIVIIPVKTVTDTFKGISEGEADLKVRLKDSSSDELGKMANYFNKFMDKLQVILNESEKQNWLKNGQSELNERMRGEQDISSLAYNIITYICKYLNAQVGVFYLRISDDTFKMVSSYAYKKRKNLSNEIKNGEGIVGQCALEKQTIVLSNIPDDYITINSGLGEAVPNNILVAPCLYHDEVKCILELGSFNSFTDIEIEFIEMIGEIIAISLNSSESRMKLKELLDKSLKQTEELQLQQEELRQANEELEEQTRALKESELLLQEQQEELRTINEELEEQTNSLKKQRDEINGKNKELEKAQKEIEEKANALELANKYKSEFLANVSHELRTPLNSILILSKLLSDKKEETAITKKDLEFANTIHSSGNDLLNLINDILDLSKVEAGKMEINLEHITLSQLVHDIESSFRQIAIEKALSFTINVSDELPAYIYTDSQRIKQIVNNLLSNAFKFTEKGGVTLSINRADQEEIIGWDIDYRKTIKITVTDTGIGIPKDKQNIIFEAFKQSDGTISRKYGGTGLGISICKELTELLGGKIILNSEVGEGTTFSIILPEEFTKEQKIEEENFKEREQRSLNQLFEEKDTVSASEHKQIQKKEIEDDFSVTQENENLLLIIEDDPDFSQILIELASQKGFKCLRAENGEIGLKLAAKYKPKAIILDIGLPDIDGWEVITKLKDNSDTMNIPIHVISGYESDKINEQEKGIVGYLRKPISLNNINELFRNIEDINGKPFKNLLIVEDNKNQRFSISELIGNKRIRTTAVARGMEAYDLLKKERFDCMILDLGLEDMSGYELLEILRKENLLQIPIIIYTGKELSNEEETKLQKYVKTIIVKGPKSMERLTSEVYLFLHSISSEISKKKHQKTKIIYENETGLSEKKILIIDDDMRNVFALASVLEEKNIRVIVGKNGKEGIVKLKENPDTDLILMDIMMPEMDGYTAMKEIRKLEQYNKIPIIALTAKAMKKDKNRCIEAGASDYLTKPVDIDKLVSLLRVWLYK